MSSYNDRTKDEGLSTVDTKGDLTVAAAEGIEPNNPMGHIFAHLLCVMNSSKILPPKF